MRANINSHYFSNPDSTIHHLIPENQVENELSRVAPVDLSEIKKCLAKLNERVTRLEKQIGNGDELASMVRNLVLHDSVILTTLEKMVDRVHTHANPNQSKNKPSASKVKSQTTYTETFSQKKSITKTSQTTFPFYKGKKNPKGFVHQFQFREQVFLIDEKLVANVVEETRCYVYILEKEKNKDRRKSKEKVIPYE